MPIYEYKCENGHVFDTMQRMSDAPLQSCEVCGAPAQRVLHAPAVHFKGSGFYNTDYGTRRRQREQKEGAGESSSAGSENGSGSSTTTASPEKKSSESATTSTASSSTPSKSSSTSSD